MFSKFIAVTAITAAACTMLGCDGTNKAEVDQGISNALTAPGKIAGAAGEAGGNLATEAVEAPGNAVDGSVRSIQDN